MKSNGVVILVSALILLQLLQGFGYDTCDNDFEKVSCYKDSTTNRALPSLLLTGRDPGSPVYDGHQIDWHNYTGYISGLACRCAAKAREAGYKYFGLQYYGECWSGNGDYAKHGKADQSKCIPDYENSCDDSNDAVCIGTGNVNYVYQLKIAEETNECEGDQVSTALGMEDGRIANDQINASTSYPMANPYHGRLNKESISMVIGGWIATIPSDAWLQVDMRKITKISAIASQGVDRVPYWVKTYSLKYSNDGNVFHDYQDSKVLNGNTDFNGIVRNILDPPIEARYIRVYPKTYNNEIGMRIELYGC